MGELGTRGTTERVHVGNSPPKVARAALLPDGDGVQPTPRCARLRLPAAPDAWRSAAKAISWFGCDGFEMVGWPVKG